MKKTQYGWVFLIVLLVLGVVIGLQDPDPKILAIIGGLFLIIVLLFYKLTIVVDDDYIRFRMGIGLTRGRYKLNDVMHCKALSYIPFGWGIRFRPGVTLFNVSGNKAIELDLSSKSRKVWIGTNCPREVANFVNEKRTGKL